MLKIANLSENLLIFVGVFEKDEIIGGNKFNRTNKNLSKSQKPKILIVLSNTNANVKDIGFLISKVSTTFTQLK